jgi:hypothetical protein
MGTVAGTKSKYPDACVIWVSQTFDNKRNGPDVRWTHMPTSILPNRQIQETYTDAQSLSS